MADPDITIEETADGFRVSVPPEAAICDFCRSTPVVCSYPCESFRLMGTNWGSQGDWAACETCRDLIDAGRLSDLAQMVSAIEADSPDQLQPLTELLQDIYKAFSVLRRGPAVPVQEDKH
jgi:hypothetical protein